MVLFEHYMMQLRKVHRLPAKLRSLAKRRVAPFIFSSNEGRPPLLGDIIMLERQEEAVLLIANFRQGSQTQ